MMADVDGPEPVDAVAVRRMHLGPALLFCPADRPDRFAKAAERADAVILDLEDAVAPEHKAAAREAVVQHPLDPATTIVRVNPVGGRAFDEDVAALARTDYRLVMLAKAELPAQMDALARFEVIALCETALGIENAGVLAAHPSTVALMWGAEDLLASLGGTSSRFAGGRYRDVARYARARVLVAARAHGHAAIDAVHLDIADTDGLHAEAADAAASGFSATAAIHPGQVATIRNAYRPGNEEVAAAERLLAAAAGSAGRGVFSLDGRMVDAPVLLHAEAVVRRDRAARRR